MNPPDELTLANMFHDEGQRHLLEVRAAVRAGKLEAPREVVNLHLARRLQEFRADIDAEVDVLASLPDCITVLISPSDGLPLFIVALQ